jgi:hypothetical protein
MGVVSLFQHLKNPGDLGFVMEVTGGMIVTPLNVVRSCGKGVPPRRP